MQVLDRGDLAGNMYLIKRLLNSLCHVVRHVLLHDLLLFAVFTDSGPGLPVWYSVWVGALFWVRIFGPSGLFV